MINLRDRAFLGCVDRRHVTVVALATIDELTIASRQLFHAFGQCFHTHGMMLRSLRAMGRQQRIKHLVAKIQMLTAPRSDEVPGRKVSHPSRPGCKVGTGRKLRKFAPQDQRRLLVNVLGISAILHERVNKNKNVSVTSAQKLGKSIGLLVWPIDAFGSL
jgi:hypothetical protein